MALVKLLCGFCLVSHDEFIVDFKVRINCYRSHLSMISSALSLTSGLLCSQHSSILSISTRFNRHSLMPISTPPHIRQSDSTLRIVEIKRRLNRQTFFFASLDMCFNIASKSLLPIE